MATRKELYETIYEKLGDFFKKHKSWVDLPPEVQDAAKKDPKIKKKLSAPELVHKSLVAHGIITNPRVIKCGEYYSWERHIKRRKYCGNVKECPMCYDRTADLKRHQILEKQEEPVGDQRNPQTGAVVENL